MRARFNTLIRTISESKTFQNLAKIALSTANAFLSVAEALTPLIPLITTLATIKLTKGFFEFSRGFVGGLKKGGGAGGAGEALGGVVTGGDRKAGAPAVKAGVDKALAQALRNNITAVRSNTTALGNLQTGVGQSSSNLVTSNANLVTSITNLIGSLRSGGAIGGFKPPKKFATGGYVSGPSHAAGGVPAVLEGGEYVIPKGFPTGGRAPFRAPRPRGPRGAVAPVGVRKLAKKGRAITPKQTGLKRKIELLEVLGLDDDHDGVFEVGGAFLRTQSGNEATKRQTFNLKIGGTKSDFAGFLKGPKGTNLAGSIATDRKAALKKLEKEFSQSIPVDILAGTLGKEQEKNFEGELRKSAEALAEATIAKFTGGKFNPTAFHKGLNAANFEQTSGNVFEAAIAGSVGKFNEDRSSANAPFDFPRGLGTRIAKYFKLRGIPTAPTDAKRTFGNESLGSIASKARNYLQDAYEQEAISERLEALLAEQKKARIGGFRSPDDLNVLIGRAKTTHTPNAARRARRLGFAYGKTLTGEERPVLFDTNQPDGGEAWKNAAQKGGTYSLEPILKAKGGSIPVDWSPRGTDTVPAMLTPGEYVINRKSAQTIGYGKLDNMNRMASGGKVQYFANGTPGGVPSPAGATRIRQGSAGIDQADSATSSLIEKLGALSVVVAGVTTSFAGLDITSMTSLVNAAAGLAFSFQQLAFFAPALLRRCWGVLKAQ